MQTTVTAIIQSILAPALMISSCGLVFLALVNRYAALNNRLRLLNDERRRLKQGEAEGTLSPSAGVRLASVEKQLAAFFQRSGMLRRALLFIMAGILLFLATSIILALMAMVPLAVTAVVPLTCFLGGLLVMFAGVLTAAVEIRRSFANIRVELDDRT